MDAHPVGRPEDSSTVAAEQLLPSQFDAQRLERFLDQTAFGSGPVAIEQIGDGHSNLTYLIRRRDAACVLRRPPPGPLPPSAHDVLREFRILRACAGHVRVPEPITACSDPSVVGAPFYLMAHVEGEVITTDLPPGHDPGVDPARIGEELVTALAEIHALDWERTDLRSLTSAPTEYLDRQLHRFSKLWVHNRTRELPLVERVTGWLARYRPSSSHTTLVHGDFRLGNTIFTARSPAVLLAVLDWELSTIGDPLADIGYLSATWGKPDGDRDPLVRLGSVVARDGFPSRRELVDRYGELTGRSVAGVRWYEVFSLWKSAIFLEGSYARLLSGTTQDPFFQSLERGVPDLIDRAWEIAGARV
jgi:aminoglycoside phosphotransferase (APT) family kinase protein